MLVCHKTWKINQLKIILQNDELDKLHSHVENVQAASESAKNFITARKEELEGIQLNNKISQLCGIPQFLLQTLGENNLEKIWTVRVGRARKDHEITRKEAETSNKQVFNFVKICQGRS